LKSQRNIFIAFLLNLFFAVFEFIGGLFTGSFAIISDSLHDLGDAAGIGISFLFEKKSMQKPDDNYTYGYTRYSVMGSLVMTLILIFGSFAIIYNAVIKLLNPAEINYNGMIFLAVVGTCVNLIAAIVTHKGESLNQKAVNLHMLEDVLGWVIVLIGAVVMKFTDITIIDPILSIAVSLFVFISALKTLVSALSVFLEKTPKEINIAEIKAELSEIEGICDVHHIHLWSMDGNNNYATMHIVTDSNPVSVKEAVKEKLRMYNISHTTLELESTNENCNQISCEACKGHHDHTHHHHH